LAVADPEQIPFLAGQIAGQKPAPPTLSAARAPQSLSDDLKAEPYAIDDLQERIKGKVALEQEKNDLDAKLQVFWPQRRPLELKVAALREEKQAMTKSLSPLVSKGAQVMAQEKDIAEKEKKAQLPQERHQLEEQRWALEQQRQEIEKQKWSQEEAIDAKSAEINAAELQLQAVATQESALRGRKEAVIEELEKVSLAQERLALIDKAAGLDLQRRNLSKEKSALMAQENLFNKEL
jgi:chromosome segregation ATPase